jgi:type IV pilus assembly protein PilE
MPPIALSGQSRESPRAVVRGFTLIELMVVTAIVAILAAIAYPTYQAQVRKSRRAAAQAFLMDVAGRQHQRMLDVRSYAPDLAALGMTPPPEVSSFYVISVPAAGPLGFTVSAAPTGAQAKDAACNPLTITQAGAKAPAACW